MPARNMNGHNCYEGMRWLSQCSCYFCIISDILIIIETCKRTERSSRGTVRCGCRRTSCTVLIFIISISYSQWSPWSRLFSSHPPARNAEELAGSWSAAVLSLNRWWNQTTSAGRTSSPRNGSPTPASWAGSTQPPPSMTSHSTRRVISSIFRSLKQSPIRVCCFQPVGLPNRRKRVLKSFEWVSPF